MMSVECVAIFWVVNGEKSCLQFSIPTGSGVGGEGGVSHSLQIWQDFGVVGTPATDSAGLRPPKAVAPPRLPLYSGREGTRKVISVLWLRVPALSRSRQ